MPVERKISPAFEQFLVEAGPNDKRDAIVIYRAPANEQQRQAARLHSLSKRLDFVRARAAAQGPVQAKLMEDYRKVSSKYQPSKRELEISSIGANTLPVAAAQVTRKTLPAIINALKDSAWHPGGTGGRPDNRWGHGVIQPLEALKAL